MSKNKVDINGIDTNKLEVLDTSTMEELFKQLSWWKCKIN